MSGFVVDSRTLLAVRDTLGRLHEQLLSMHTGVEHERGTLGGDWLEAELERFCAGWHYGVSELGGQLQDLTRRLGEAAEAYERIERRIIQAGSGSGSSTGSAPSHTGSPVAATHHHAAAKHDHSVKHEHPAKHHRNSTAPGGSHYSGGAGLAPAPGSANHRGKRCGGEKHSGRGHHSGSGSGVTIIGGGPTQSSSSGGSGTTTIDEKIHHSEERQRAELEAVLRMVHG